MNRTLRAALFGGLVLALTADSHAGGMFGGLFSGDVYTTFNGKFIDTDDVKSATAAPQRGTAGSLGFSGSGGLIGTSTWDAIPAQTLNDYANGILKRLLAGWSGPHPAIRLHVISDPGFQANSTGAGDIFISRGWFVQCQYEDQIAAIIAHEMSHILLDHFAREEANEGRRRAIAGAASASIAAYTLGSTRVTQSGTQVHVGVDNQRKLNDDVQRTLIIKFAIEEVTSFAFNSAWAREQEEEADLLGIDLLARAHYSVRQMTEALKTLQKYEAESAAEADTLSAEYKAAMEDAAQSGDINAMEGTAKKAMVDALLRGASRLHDRLSRNHPDYDVRIKAVQAYIAREYDDDGKPDDAALNAFRAKGGVKPIFDNHTSADGALAQLRESNYAQARLLASRGASGPTANFPYPLRVMGETEQKAGDAAGGVKLLQRAVQSPDAAFATLSMLAGMYSDMGDYGQAHATIDLAARRFGSVEATYPDQITLALKEGKKSEADRLLATCTAVNNSDLADACHDAHGDTCTGAKILCQLGQSGDNVTDIVSHIIPNPF